MYNHGLFQSRFEGLWLLSAIAYGKALMFLLLCAMMAENDYYHIPQQWHDAFWGQLGLGQLRTAATT